MIGNLFEYKDNRYIVLHEGKMKLPSGVWIDAIFYKQSQVESYYCRAKSDFLTKFKNLDINAIPKP